MFVLHRVNISSWENRNNMSKLRGRWKGTIARKQAMDGATLPMTWAIERFTSMYRSRENIDRNS
jgi:hypothetical protein